MKKEAHASACASFCGGSRIRTGDPMLAKHMLYQLSYTPSIIGGYAAPKPLAAFPAPRLCLAKSRPGRSADADCVPQNNKSRACVRLFR